MSSHSVNLDQLNDVDWSFASLGNSGLHALHWYPATYIGAIPGTLIRALTKADDLVLDPFCGSGTSGVEALRAQRRFLGIDNNPVATLITQMKLHMPDINALKKGIRHIGAASALLPSEYFGTREHKNESELALWYHPRTYEELKAILGGILEINSHDIQACLLGVFSSILKTTCSQGRHWGWVCDNVKPRPEEVVYKNARHHFIEAAEAYISAINETILELKENQLTHKRQDIRKSIEIQTGSCIEVMSGIKPKSVDLILTSPPYYGVADYVKSQRLSYLWLDLPELQNRRITQADFPTLRESEAGARSKRHRSTSFEDYIRFMGLFFHQSQRVLKKSSHLALVVGESSARERTTERLMHLAQSTGLEIVYRHHRQIKNTRRRMMAKVAQEEIIILRKER